MAQDPVVRYELKRSTVVVDAIGVLYNGETDRNVASGALVSRDGHILTALHVIGEPDQYREIRLSVYFTDFAATPWDSKFSPPFSASLVTHNEPYDLAIIKLDNPAVARALPIVPLAFAPRLVGERQLVGYSYPTIDLSNPLSQEPASTEAKVSRGALERPFWELSGAANPGDSGGPLLDAQTGRAVAVTHGRVAQFRLLDGSVEQVQSIMWAIPLDPTVQRWMQQHVTTVSAVEPYPIASEISTIRLAYADLARGGGVGTWNDHLFAAAPFGREVTSATVVRTRRDASCAPVGPLEPTKMRCTERTDSTPVATADVLLNGALVVVAPLLGSEADAYLEMVSVPRKPLLVGDLRVGSVEFAQAYRFSRWPTVSRLRPIAGNTIVAATFVPSTVDGIYLADVVIGGQGSVAALGGTIEGRYLTSRSVAVDGTVVAYEVPATAPPAAIGTARTQLGGDLARAVTAWQAVPANASPDECPRDARDCRS